MNTIEQYFPVVLFVFQYLEKYDWPVLCNKTLPCFQCRIDVHSILFISSSKHLFMPIGRGSSGLTSSHSSLSALTVLISLLRRSNRTPPIFPWSVQLYFFFSRAKNCSSLSTPLLAPGVMLKRIIKHFKLNLLLGLNLKATEQYFLVILFIMLYRVVLLFEYVDEILKCEHSNESYWGLFSRGAVYYAVQCGSNLNVSKCEHSKEGHWEVLFCDTCLLCCLEYKVIHEFPKRDP